jgi:hypothetical protein
MNLDPLQSIGVTIFATMVICLLLAMLLFFVVIRQLKRINVPNDAGFSETLLYTPFLVVVFIDLLDFALDILAAPFSWAILDRLGLKALRNVSAFEALLPFTQFIPTMTLAWFAARVFGPRFDTIEQIESNFTPR